MNECQDFSPEKSPAVRLVQMSRVTQMKIVKGKKRKKKEKKGLVLSFLGVWVGGGGRRVLCSGRIWLSSPLGCAAGSLSPSLSLPKKGSHFPLHAPILIVNPVTLESEAQFFFLSLGNNQFSVVGGSRSPPAPPAAPFPSPQKSPPRNVS